MTAALRITHNATEGTLLVGELSRTDAVNKVMRTVDGWQPEGFRHHWCVPRSKGAQPKTPKINAAVLVLEAAGFAVELRIDRIGCKGEPS